jgi:hypothetical protein
MPLLDNTLPLSELIMQMNHNLLVLNPFAYNIMAKVKHGVYIYDASFAEKLLESPCINKPQDVHPQYGLLSL